MKLHPVSLQRLSAAAALGTLIAMSVLAAPAALAGEAAYTATAAGEVSFSPGPPTLPAGAEIAVLLGNPAEEGPFVLRLKFPAGYQVPPHRHPQEEHVTVISGGLGIAAGEMLDTSAASLLVPGSFVRIPVGQAHFAWTEAETVVQLNGVGPFGIEYIEAADDPRIN